MAKQATFIQKGENIDYVAGADIAYGDVVPLTNRIGVALETIANGDIGSVTLTGVFECPAINTAAFAVGDMVFWDDTANKLTNIGLANTPAGIVVETKAETGTTAVISIGIAGLDGQADVADVATADGSDAGTTQALANALKVKVNALLAALRSAGVIG